MSTDVNSISSSSISASYSSAASSASTQPVEKLEPHHRHHDGGEKMMGDVTSALSSLGINVDTLNSDTKSTLSSFMHTLMGSLRGGAEGAGERENDNDGDDQAGAVPAGPPPQAGSNPFKQGLDSLIAALNSDNGSNPALAKLQEQFNAITGSSSQGGSKVTLQDFLSAFGSKLPQEPPQNGYMVNTTA